MRFDELKIGQVFTGITGLWVKVTATHASIWPLRKSGIAFEFAPQKRVKARPDLSGEPK